METTDNIYSLHDSTGTHNSMDSSSAVELYVLFQCRIFHLEAFLSSSYFSVFA